MKRPSKHQTYADKLQDQRAGLDTGRKFSTGGGDRAGSGGGYKEVDERALRDAQRRKEDDERDTEQRKADRKRCSSCKRFKCVC